ncbi:MAG: bifunctional metallophosphatase/5'-nucleotidase [Calditrichaeota bacterium]|nr:bifunctional metallophosphatase/5'-nucleotidase [Calditrichota bacterium]
MLSIFRGMLFCFASLVSMALAQPRHVTILHVNDIHGHFLPEPVSRSGDSLFVGGFEALSHYLRLERTRNPNSLFLDAGDIMTGNPICNRKHRGVFGGALVEMLEMLDCNAAALGNHEFDISQQNARILAAMSVYPMLCANLVDSTRHPFAPKGTAIYEIGGVRIGVIGLIFEDLRAETNSSNLQGLEVKNIAQTAQERIDELDPITDLIILLTHNGIDKDRELARRIHHADVIVGGHSHTRLTEPLRENGILIVQAGCHLRELGVLDLEVVGDTVFSYRGRLIPVVVKDIQPDSRVAAFCDSFRLLLEAEYGQVIGQLAVDWIRGYHEESNIGNWICDRMRDALNADVAFVNAGGIRTDIPAGPVTRLQIAELLPFNNAIVLFNATGAQLSKFAEIQARREHGIVEMSGMKIRYRVRGETIDTLICEIGGESLESARTYRVVSIDYLAISQWERYLGFQPQNVQQTGQLLSDFVTAQVQQTQEPIYSKVEGRLKRLP